MARICKIFNRILSDSARFCRYCVPTVTTRSTYRIKGRILGQAEVTVKI